jgi:uncharacterized metal-binding protein
MSCLAGVGALKLHFLKQLRNRERWAIDGCPIQCAKGVFQQAQERVDVHIRLHDFGVRKNSQPTPECSIERLVNEAMKQVASQLPLSVGESAHKGESPIANAPHFAISRSEMASAFKEGPR